MKKVPPGAEASNILVGEVKELTREIMAFVRLHKAVMLPDLTEVAVPTRFIFMLLGPSGNQQKYHEIGRSIATLMSDEVYSYLNRKNSFILWERIDCGCPIFCSFCLE